MKIIGLIVMLFLLGCSYCSIDTNCIKCSGECVSNPVTTCADQASGSFDCKCNGGKCEKVKVDECRSDHDCVISGCSGTVCQSIHSEPYATTCEWKQEYACYKVIDCVCDHGKCAWDINRSFDRCIEDVRAAGAV